VLIPGRRLVRDHLLVVEVPQKVLQALSAVGSIRPREPRLSHGKQPNSTACVRCDVHQCKAFGGCTPEFIRPIHNTPRNTPRI
jgi:hypothetical protein